jgi:hypothetical protein
MHEPYPGQYVWNGFADIERWMSLIQARRDARAISQGLAGWVASAVLRETVLV